uniref:Alternative protein LOC442572 n=1 Tax=Homo sapiens TaxID=9606 RepID=L8ECQ1_HUMAN|nr:alternative protein LOC442572 [Homo sapiens]
MLLDNGLRLGQWQEIPFTQDLQDKRSAWQLHVFFFQTGCQVGMNDDIRDSDLPDWRDRTPWCLEISWTTVSSQSCSPLLTSPRLEN